MLNLEAPLDRIVALLKTIEGLEDDADGAHIFIGVPGSLPTRASAYVAIVGPRQVREAVTQIQAVEVGYFIGFGYRVAVAPSPATLAALEAAERAICGYLAAWLDIMKQAVNRKLNNGTTNLVDDARLEFPGVAAPQYMPLAGQEHRVLPVLVWTEQRQGY